MGGVQVEGSSVACLVAADCLARAKVPVRFVPTGPLARSFAPRVLDGLRLEVGARLLELSYDDDSGTRERRRPTEYTGGDHRPWMMWISDYIASVVEPRPVRVFIERPDAIGADFLLSGDLRSLPGLCTVLERRAIEADARKAQQHFPLGMSRLDLAGLTYRKASQLLHGRAFHDLFIGPLLDAIVGPEGDLSATQHRAVWLPLFRPDEVLAGIEGVSQRPRRSMCLGMGEMVEALIARAEVLVDAALPKGPSSVITDVDSVPAPYTTLHVAWLRTDLDDRVRWFYAGERFPYRETISAGVACWEVGPAWPGRWPDHVLADAKVRVPLGAPPTVDPKAGRIGAGNFNSQILQGIVAAAHRLKGMR